MNRWKRVASRTVIEDQWLKVTADRCELPNGSTLDPFYVIHEKEWVHVLAAEKGQLLVVTQYRYAADTVCMELPGGIVEENEDPLDAAKRELREETGYTAARWTYAGSTYANPARQTNRIHIFVAQDLTGGKTELDSSEDIQWGWAAITDIPCAIRQGKFSQSLHIASYYVGIEAVMMGTNGFPERGNRP